MEKILRSLLAINATGKEVYRLIRELETDYRSTIADGVGLGDPPLGGFLQLRRAKKALKLGRYGLVCSNTYTDHVLLLLRETGELIVTVRGLCRGLFPEKLSSSVICRNGGGSHGLVKAVNVALPVTVTPLRVNPVLDVGAQRRFLMSGELPVVDRNEEGMLEDVAGELAGTPGCRPGDDDPVVVEYYRNRKTLIAYAASENFRTCHEFLDLCMQIERQTGVPLFSPVILDDTSSLFVVILDGAEEKRVRAEIGKQRARRQKACERLARGVSGRALDEAVAVIECDAWEVQPWSAFYERFAENPGAFAPDIAWYLGNPFLQNPFVFG